MTELELTKEIIRIESSRFDNSLKNKDENIKELEELEDLYQKLGHSLLKEEKHIVLENRRNKMIKHEGFHRKEKINTEFDDLK